jgi:hypothetical protein
MLSIMRRSTSAALSMGTAGLGGAAGAAARTHIERWNFLGCEPLLTL